ncbi:hypothetical protein [Luteococcus sp.]|uniref:hypothetical protein n=1 Tax=Luteococcus sp. TaxID=1969402 RepID=UPI003735981B
MLTITGCASTSTPSPEPNTSATSAAASSTPAAGTPSPVVPVGQKAAKKEGNDYSLTLYPLQRSGDAVVLTFDLVATAVTKQRPADTSFLSDPTDPVSGAKGIPNGVALIDGPGGKVYMPATTTQKLDTAVCTPALPARFTQGDSMAISCTYAGVPAVTRSLTVNIPTFGSIPNVPIH